MSVDTKELRALHAATTQGRWSEGDSGGTLHCFGKGALLGIGSARGYGQWGVFVNERDAAFVAFVHEVVLPLCDRVERAEAEVERLRTENARLAGELAEVRDNYSAASDGPMGRLYALYYAAATDVRLGRQQRNAMLWMLAADCRIQAEYAAFYAKHSSFETAVHNADGCGDAADVLWRMVSAMFPRRAV